jgi:hypothetical protein
VNTLPIDPNKPASEDELDELTCPGGPHPYGPCGYETPEQLASEDTDPDDWND